MVAALSAPSAAAAATGDVSRAEGDQRRARPCPSAPPPTYRDRADRPAAKRAPRQRRCPGRRRQRGMSSRLPEIGGRPAPSGGRDHRVRMTSTGASVLRHLGADAGFAVIRGVRPVEGDAPPPVAAEAESGQ
jgi:hypothetical protein